MVAARKIGILGGTFDPVHRGHLAMAEVAAGELGLEQVILVPAGRPMSKPDKPITPSTHRLAMVRLAIKYKPYLSVSTLEIDRPGPSYTIDTLEELQQQNGRNAVLYFILGWDSLEQLPGWYEPDKIIRMCLLVAVPRPGVNRPDMHKLEAKIPGINERVILLDEPNMDISATEIRHRISLGLSVADFLPAPVAAYIKEHELYREIGG